MKDFQNKVAAITGAASGMGRTLALELARRGCHLALSDVNEAGLAETARQTAQINPALKVSTHRVDTGVREQIEQWAADVVAAHGKVNLIFNNAGVAMGSLIEDVRMEDFEWIMRINFWGVVWGTQAFLPHLRASGEGHVVNTSSLFGLLASPMNGPYNASKFAVRGYTEALRMELELTQAPVSATCVHPGGIRTEIARAARYNPASIQRLGLNPAEMGRRFDKLLNRTTAQEAAGRILLGVQRNERRVLVGSDARFLDKVVRLLGSAYQPLLLRQTRRLYGMDRR